MARSIVVWGRGAASLDAWSATAAPGSRAKLGVDASAPGGALRFDFELAGARSWAIARRAITVRLPAQWVVIARLRGDARPNELQLKLVDPSGANVWWWRRPDFVLTADPRRLALHRASLEFAWGPLSGGEPDRIGALEIAVAAGGGGAGTLWVDDLRIEPRRPTAGSPRPRRVRASSSVAGHEPERALDGDTATTWRPDPRDPDPWIQLDLGSACRWGGLLVDFAGGDGAPRCRLLASDTGKDWTVLVDETAVGRRRWLRAGEAESRAIRLELPAGDGGGVIAIAVAPIELAVSPVRWAQSVARAAPRGRFPRHLLGEQGYWAVVGGDGDERKGLLGEDGALEIEAEGFTIEPLLWADGQLITWADAERRMSLADSYLPIPSVEWAVRDLHLRVTAFVSGDPGRSMLVARYVVESESGCARTARLLTAIRPFQVLPAWHRLNVVGGLAPIVRLERAGARVQVDEVREVVAVSAPDGFGAARVDEGWHAVLEGRLPPAERVDDPLGFAEGMFAFDLGLCAGGSHDIVLAVPLHADTPAPRAGLPRAEAAAWGTAQLEAAVGHWRARLAPVPLELPPGAAHVTDTVRASVGWILVNREGPRIQPGPRCYRRTWIRDGSLTATALAEMGFADDARAFLRWYAPYQHEDGRVPCAVDRHGVDPTPEHDSHGQLAWAVIEVFRLTGDHAFLRELWPRVVGALEAIAALRAERTTEAFRTTPFFGLLPESISHEGYASRPAHAYWDDFFAVRALADAADAAIALGDGRAAERFAVLRDGMRRDLHASIAAAMVQHGIDFIPGSAELADFDPTSTAIAFDPGDEGGRLPREALERTFARYWAEFEARRDGRAPAEAYTPYEIRNAVALLQLGWKPRALALLDWLLADQRPPAWRQWPEVAWREPRAPRFLGDLPHGWVASTFVRTLRRLLAYERDDGALVVAAGVPEVWVREEPGLRLRGLPTHFGALDLTMRATREGCVQVAFGAGLRRPPGGIVLESPFVAPLREVVIDGHARPADDPRRARLDRAPAEVLFRY